MSTTPPLRELRKLARERFLAGRKAETEYGRRLKQIAKQIDVIVRGFSPQGLTDDVSELMDTLYRYGDLLKPWAESVAERMIADVARRDATAWHQHGKQIGRLLRQEIANAPIGEAVRKSMAEQVHYITSLPRDAAERVHKLSVEAVTNGTRASELAKAILETGSVSKSRAMLIARTEVARTASVLTMERALHVGCTHYIWHTAHDGRVRKSHKEMDGKTVSYSEVPLLSDGTRTHSGMIFNCRCFQSPVLN